VLLLGLALPLAAGEADRLREQAAASNRAWELLESLTTKVGARPVGSPGMTRAKEWAIAKLTALGFSNVHAEVFSKENAWVRGMESATVLTNYPRSIAIAGLGNSAATPAEGIEAEVILFPTLWELIQAPRESLLGKIAFVNQPMVRTQNEEGYRNAVRARTEGRHSPQSVAPWRISRGRSLSATLPCRTRG
jgi:hypothetical protein